MKTRIKLHCNLGYSEYPSNPLQAGEHEVDEVFAAKLIARNLATRLPPKAAAVQAATTAAPSPEFRTFAEPAKTTEPTPPKPQAKATKPKE